MHPACPRWVAVQADELVGLATFAGDDEQCELVTLDALRQRQGVGSALLAQVTKQAAQRGCWRVWLITTNDNINAVRFYKRRGLRLIAVHRGAVDEARRIKPTIPVIVEHGISVHDEFGVRTPAQLMYRQDTHRAKPSRPPGGCCEPSWTMPSTLRDGPAVALSVRNQKCHVLARPAPKLLLVREWSSLALRARVSVARGRCAGAVRFG